ncbi:MAG TPA: helix-turn-helix transcriptional regulator [Vicinamibacterales bacterium]|nr:helix-turn-helix transcriptional regulator [Vicinamibacterales bacterium]
MQYAEHAPIPELAPVVELVWTLSGDAATLGVGTQPILPDGRPELILHFGDAFERVHADNRIERQPTIIFAGQLRCQLLLRPTGVIGVLGVRFHPYGAAALFAAPQNALAGLTIGVDALDTALSRALSEVRQSAAGLDDGVTRVQQELLRWVTPGNIDPRVRSAVQAIDREQGLVSIDDLAASVSLTRRHLERRFLKTVGITPKRLARITRFQHALSILGASDAARPGTRTAAACGYADQAHFIRDFRELAGCPPGEHLLRQFALTDAFTNSRV